MKNYKESRQKGTAYVQ